MCFFFSFVPATFWAIVGYFVLFSSRKAEGNVRTLGQVLAIWTFVLAVMIPIIGAYVTIAGLCPIDSILGVQD
jgi:uncharacterized membrane protein